MLLGCLIDSSLLKRPTFDLGVLQLIGLSYMLGTLLYDLPLTRRLLVAVALLAAHWAAIHFAPIPGAGAGVFTESQNLIDHLNRVYLQPISLRGLISMVPMAALVLVGTALGDALRRELLSPINKVAQLLIAGLALAGIGWLWSFDLPFNKPVWTASYVLYAAGLGTLALGALYLLIDVTGWRAPGVPVDCARDQCDRGLRGPDPSEAAHPGRVDLEDAGRITAAPQPGDAALLFRPRRADPRRLAVHGGYILFWWLVLLWLYRKRVFVRV